MPLSEWAANHTGPIRPGPPPELESSVGVCTLRPGRSRAGLGLGPGIDQAAVCGGRATRGTGSGPGTLPQTQSGLWHDDGPYSVSGPAALACGHHGRSMYRPEAPGDPGPERRSPVAWPATPSQRATVSAGLRVFRSGSRPLCAPPQPELAGPRWLRGPYRRRQLRPCH